jgi:hypothetical protein
MVADDFRQKGYVVPGIQILVESEPDETQVRYFHAADESDAQKILEQLAVNVSLMGNSNDCGSC